MSSVEDRELTRKKIVAAQCVARGMEFGAATYGKDCHPRLMAANPAVIRISSTYGYCMLSVMSGLPWFVCKDHVPKDLLGLAGRGFVTGWGGIEDDEFPILDQAAQTAVREYQRVHATR